MNKSIEQEFDQVLAPDQPQEGPQPSPTTNSSENLSEDSATASSQTALNNSSVKRNETYQQDLPPRDSKEDSSSSHKTSGKSRKKQRNSKSPYRPSPTLLPSSPRDLFARDSVDHVYDIRFLLNQPLSLTQLESYSPAYARARYEKEGCTIKDVILVIFTNQQRFDDCGTEIFNGEPVVHMERFQIYKGETLEFVPNSHFTVYLVNALYDGKDERGDLMRALRRSSLEEIQNCRIH